MLYNKNEHSRYVRIAGKISIAAAVIGFSVFLVALMVDVGAKSLSQVSAQTNGSATTTLTVLNTPPNFDVAPFEVPESSTSTPINTGDIISWQAIGSDSNDAPYFLLICSTNASPTPDFADAGDGDGNGPPQCDAGAVQWGVSASTTSGTLATVSTTTASTAISQFTEVNEWFAWVCDDDAVNPRCNNITLQGPTTTSASSSPFHVNNRPNLISVANTGPVDPGGLLDFTSVATDPDLVDAADSLRLVVCATAGFSTSTDTCTGTALASTTIPSTFTSNPTSTYSIASVRRDQLYGAEVYLVDEHGHEASIDGINPYNINADFTVNNVAPTLVNAEIVLNDGLDLDPSIPGAEDTGFELRYKINDANSCFNSTDGDEIVGANVALFRSPTYSTTTCDGVDPSDYNPNHCYTTAVPTTTWNISCTASSTCDGYSDPDRDYNCTFPLWFVADPTDGGSPFSADDWLVAVSGIDDDNASSSLVESNATTTLVSFTALDLLTTAIPYGALEPGGTSTVTPTTTVLSVGNTGLDQEVSGESMCGTYTILTECPVSASSTVPESQQQFASTTFTYGVDLFPLILSSTSDTEIELDVNKTTSTSSPEVGDTYWGIEVPASISLAGSYQGLNTFMAVIAEPGDW